MIFCELIYFLQLLLEMLHGYSDMGDQHVVDPRLASKAEDVEFPSHLVAFDPAAEYVKNENKSHLLSRVVRMFYLLKALNFA